MRLPIGNAWKIAAALLLALPAAGWAQPICVECVSVRLGRPVVVRGPAEDELDAPFNEIRLNNGLTRGFSANGSTYAIDGQDPWSMGGIRQEVISPGMEGEYDECGRWLFDTEKVGQTVHGFFHAESSCDYTPRQVRTHKSMGFATSSNEGLCWTVHGPIITGTDAPNDGAFTGEGDCTVVNGGDGYYYAYCLRLRDWRTIVARAPVANPFPGNWFKYHNGLWNEMGVGGDATALGALGTTAARWVDNNNILLLDLDPWFGGMKASFSHDKTTFSTLDEPLIPLDDWTDPAEKIAYPSIMNYGDVNNQITNPFLLTYTYVQPRETFSQKYLVFRDVWMGVSASPVTPQVGIALSRWYNAANHDRWSTTAPIPGSNTSYVYEGFQGYLMTKPHPTLPSIKLEDCVDYWPGHPDHMLTNDGTCNLSNRLRTAGWVYRDPQPDTLPVYRCYNPVEQHHFASNQSNCDGLGYVEWLLGYALAH